MGLPENIGYRGHLPALNSIAVRGAIAMAIVCLLPLHLTYGTPQSTKTNVSVVLKDQSENHSTENHQKDPNICEVYHMHKEEYKRKGYSIGDA
jgi:hypothetical protein